MINNLASILNSESFKAIKPNLSIQEFVDTVIPKGFESIVQVHTDEYEVFIQTVSDEMEYQREISINPSLFNPDYIFPKFCFTDLSSHKYVMNQNQLFHLLLIERFQIFLPMKRPYLNLITQDISSIMRYINYNKVNSYNARKKMESLTTYFYFKSFTDLMSSINTVMKTGGITENIWKTLMPSNDVGISSIGSMSNSNSLSSQCGYRSPCYQEDSKGFKSIFPPKQNIPARLQTHLLGDSFKLENPSQSIIQQDNLVDSEGNLVRKDDCLLETIVVFHPISKAGRFLSGEIEITPDIAYQLIKTNSKIEECFLDIFVEVGKTYTCDFKPFIIGTTLEDKEIIVSNFKEFTVLSIESIGINNAKKIKIMGVRYTGNGRIISNTGLKGVTKVRNDLGYIGIHHTQESEDKAFEEGFSQKIEFSNDKYLDLALRYPSLNLESLDAYPAVHKEPTEDKIYSRIITPQLVCGMNSVKGKSNTIVLAKACLAVKLGYYTPSVKFGFEGLLNSLDEDEINEAAEALPPFTYVNEKGETIEVEIGLVYISYTEICGIYTSIKPQSFAFESGRHLYGSGEKGKELYKHIWDNYLEDDKVKALFELYKIDVLNSTQQFDNSDNLPIYSIDDVNEIFSHEDLILEGRNQFPSSSLLIDEDWNKGFFIDLSRFENAPIIRIPSAETLKLFSGVLPNGETIYHINLINVSKIIRGCLKTNGTYKLNTVYSKDPSRYSSSLAYDAYCNTIRSTIYSGNEFSHRLIQTLIKPKIMGCSLKQTIEELLPNGTVVVTDDQLYSRLKSVSLQGNPMKNSVSTVELWYKLIEYQDADKYSKKQLADLFESLLDDCPRAFAIRNPSLWQTQLCNVRVWDRFTFEVYLKLKHNKTIDEVLNTYCNRDLLLVSPDVIVKSHGDADGDLLPLFVLNHEGQELLKTFELKNIVPKELEWHKAYYNKEYSSTMDLKVEHKYKVYYVTWQDYYNFLINACVAKGNIGLSTLDIWAFSSMLEVYQQYGDDNNWLYKKKGENIPMVKLTPMEYKELGYIYTRLVQEMVVEGIKHTSNGSKDFDIYFLKSIGTKANERKIRKDLRQIFGVDNALIDKLLFIIRFSKDNNDLIKASQNVISLYNKGKFPYDSEALDNWEESLINSTYFGSLVKPLFDIRTKNIQTLESNVQKLETIMSEDFSDVEFVY